MKKLIAILTISLLLVGCGRNVGTLTTLPSDSPSYAYDKVDNEAVMTKRATGQDVVLTKREVKQLKKDSSDVVENRADIIFENRYPGSD